MSEAKLHPPLNASLELKKTRRCYTFPRSRIHFVISRDYIEELTRFLVDDGSDPGDEGDSLGQPDEQQYTPHVLSIIPSLSTCVRVGPRLGRATLGEAKGTNNTSHPHPAATHVATFISPAIPAIVASRSREPSRIVRAPPKSEPN